MATIDIDLRDRPRESKANPRLSKSESASPILADLDLLADLLDSRWRIPGTSIRLGMDALAGLIPLVGDAATGIVSVYIVLRAREHGAGNALIARMVGNVALDTIVGSVPIVGSIFDVYFKANKRNIRLLKRHLDRTRQ